jgi:predicted Zn-dependent protease
MNMFMAPGDATTEDMIAGMKRGLIVTRFWYTRTVHPLNVVVTGMTRDGTFLIEGGRIARGLRNLRYNESVLDVLSRAELFGREAQPTLFDYVGNTVVAPALKVREFNFTGVTRF